MKITNRIRAFLRSPKGQQLTKRAREEMNKPTTSNGCASSSNAYVAAPDQGDR
jgi:hypothetical protein